MLYKSSQFTSPSHKEVCKRIHGNETDKDEGRMNNERVEVDRGLENSDSDSVTQLAGSIS